MPAKGRDWATVLQLELKVLMYVRSLHRASFSMYVDALRELAVWFHPCPGSHQLRALDSCASTRHGGLPTTHPEIAEEFRAGNFMVQETNRPFSAIPVDQAHEQNNAAIKGHDTEVQ